MSKLIQHSAYILRTCLLALFVVTSAFAQGKGHGAGGGRGAGGGPPSGVGVDRGLGNASSRSDGRSDAGLDRARTASSNLHKADDDLRDHPGLAPSLHTNANDLRAGYQAALATNPNLTFGNYVAATRLSQNLGSRFPNITRDAILNGLASGRSIGQTLQDLGLSSSESKDARKQADREIKDARKH